MLHKTLIRLNHASTVIFLLKYETQIVISMVT